MRSLLRRLFLRRKPKQKPSDFSLPYYDIVFRSRGDNVLLRGWFIIGRNRKCIIMAHGGFRNRADPTIGNLEIAAGLSAAGYSVLMFDSRGHGESEGEWTSAGLEEAKDILGAFDYLLSGGHPSQSIGILGFSMGAVAALLAAAQEKRIAAVIADSAFARYSWVRKGLREWLILTLFLGKVKTADPLDVAADIKARILFINGAEDPTVLPRNAFALLDAAGRKERGNWIWIAPGAGHTRAFRLHPEEYIPQIISFFDQNLAA